MNQHVTKTPLANARKSKQMSRSSLSLYPRRVYKCVSSDRITPRAGLTRVCQRQSKHLTLTDYDSWGPRAQGPLNATPVKLEC